jgi:hypothetical protein
MWNFAVVEAFLCKQAFYIIELLDCVEETWLHLPISFCGLSSLQSKIFSLKFKLSALNSRVLGKQLHYLGF